MTNCLITEWIKFFLGIKRCTILFALLFSLFLYFDLKMIKEAIVVVEAACLKRSLNNNNQTCDFF
jgi:hypothetical protein